VKKGTTIGIVIAVVIVVIVIVGVSTVFAGEQITSNSNEKYVIIPQILRETPGMDGFERSYYLVENYKGNPLYDYECQRIWDEQFSNEVDGAELWFILRDVCHQAKINMDS